MCFTSVKVIEEKLTPYERHLLHRADNARRSAERWSKVPLESLSARQLAHQEETIEALESLWMQSVDLLCSSPGYWRLPEAERQLLEQQVFGYPAEAA
jgi:hypothetical protein